jgi:DNA-binding beta-propeller fold protein YncE
MNDFDRMLGSALKRVRDEHAASDPDLRSDLLRRGKRRRTLRLTGAAAGAVAVLVLAATAIPILRDEAAPGPAGERQPTVTETFDISFPAAMVANDDNVWVASQDGLMSRIDASTNEVIEGSAALSEPGVKDMALGPDGIWVASWEGDIGPGGEAQSELHLMDPKTMKGAFPVPEFNGDVALYAVAVAGDGSTWAVDAARGRVFKIDFGAPDLYGIEEVTTGRFPVDVVTAAGGAWVSNSKSGTITEIDARAGQAVGEFPVECPGDLVVAFGSLWVTNYCENQIRLIDLSGPRVVANIPTGKGPHALVEAGGYIWVLNTLDETVVRVDPSTNRVIGDPIQVGARPEAIVAGGGAVWVANQGGEGTVSRIDFEPQPDPDFTPLPTPSPSPTPTPTPAPPPSPTPAPADGFAIWPETTPAQAEAVCDSNAPEWRASDAEVAERFAREVLGWSDATPPEVIQIGKSGEKVMSISRSGDEPAIRAWVSVAPTLFGRDCLSAVGVSRPDDGEPMGLSVSVDGAVVDLGWDPQGAARAEVRVSFGGLEHRTTSAGIPRPLVKEVTAPRARFYLDAPPAEPGYFLVLLRDDGREVMSAMGGTLPAGDFTSG